MLFLFSSVCETSKEVILFGKVISSNEGETAVHLSLSLHMYSYIKKLLGEH